jgi:hypothetical protein
MNNLLRELHQERLLRSLSASAELPAAAAKKKRSNADKVDGCSSSSKRQRNKSSKPAQKACEIEGTIDISDDEESTVPHKSETQTANSQVEHFDMLLALQLQAQFDAESSSQAADAAEQQAAYQGANVLSSVQNALVQNGLQIRIG